MAPQRDAVGNPCLHRKISRLHLADLGGRVLRIMDFTPEDMEAVRACLDGIDRQCAGLS
jgi:hypothetical protein